MADILKAAGKNVIQFKSDEPTEERKSKKAKEQEDAEQGGSELNQESAGTGDTIDENKAIAPLFEQPLEVHGSRIRKPVDRLDTKAESLHQEELGKKRHEISPGRGEKLGAISKIADELRVMKTADLYVLHRLLFKRRGTSYEIKKNIKEFSGFPFEKHEKEFKLRKATLRKASLQDLKLLCKVLHLERGGTKPEIVDRVMEFLLLPKRRDVDKSNASPKGQKKKGRGKSEKDNPTDDDAGTAKEIEATRASTEESNDEEPQSRKKRKKDAFSRKDTTVPVKKAKKENSGKGEKHFHKESQGKEKSSTKGKDGEEEESLMQKSSEEKESTQEASDLEAGEKLNDAGKIKKIVEKERPKPNEKKGGKSKSKLASVIEVGDEKDNTASKSTEVPTMDVEEVNEAPVKKRNAKKTEQPEKNRNLEREEMDEKGKLKDDQDEDATEEETAQKKTAEAVPLKTGTKKDKKKQEKGDKTSSNKGYDKERKEEVKEDKDLPKHDKLPTLKKTQETPTDGDPGENKHFKDVDSEFKSVSEGTQKANKSARKGGKAEQITDPSTQADETEKHIIRDKPQGKVNRKEKGNPKTGRAELKAESAEKDDGEEHQEIGKHEREAKETAAYKPKGRSARKEVTFAASKETKEKKRDKKNEDFTKKAEAGTSAGAEAKDINNGDHEAAEPKRKNDAKEGKKAKQVTYGNEGDHDEPVLKESKPVPTDEEILETIKQITGQFKEAKPSVKTVFQSVLEQYSGIDLSKKKKIIEANIRKLMK